jgi:hypothetical protein
MLLKDALLTSNIMCHTHHWRGVAAECLALTLTLKSVHLCYCRCACAVCHASCATRTTGEVLLLSEKSLSSGLKARCCRLRRASLVDRKPSKP